MRELTEILTAATLLCVVAATPIAAGPQMPSLVWTPLSDWIDVKGSDAKGDGVADDTPAIQRVLDGAESGSTIYLPPGTYRITASLRLTGPLVGVLVIGHGRDTKLRWDGPPGGMIFADDGVAYSRYVGLQFDGAGKAAAGFHHDSHKRDGTVMDIRGYGGEIFFGPNQFYASLPSAPLVHDGNAKLDVFLVGNCFFKTPLVVEKGPAMNLHLVGNHSVAAESNDTVRDHEARAADNATPQDLARIARALDDLRRVGELDLKINHSQ